MFRIYYKFFRNFYFIFNNYQKKNLYIFISLIEIDIEKLNKKRKYDFIESKKLKYRKQNFDAFNK